MFELHQIGKNTFYIESPPKIGIYRVKESDVYLIDSGNDKDAGRKIRKILDEQGWNLKGIINTHSNADHIGGNRYLQQQTGCPIFAAGIEAAFTRFPILEPSFLYGGYPCKDLRHKFLLAQDSQAKEITDPGFPKELEAIPLKGHFFDMIGIRTPDQAVFLADCVSSEKTLEKYQITFIYDVAEYLRTLDLVEEMKKLEDRRLPDTIDYTAIEGLRLEARQKLSRIRPKNLGQASRVSGVSPADVAVLMVYLKQREGK